MLLTCWICLLPRPPDPDPESTVPPVLGCPAVAEVTLTWPVIGSELTDPLGKVTRVPHPDVLIHATGLTKRFGEFTAVDGIDFELRRGEAFGFLGPTVRVSPPRCA